MINFPLTKVYLESVDSTNSYLKRIIKESAPANGVAVMAKNQSSGRGRLGRIWQSSEGETLCMSIAVQNTCTEGFTLLAALAVYQGLKRFCDDSELRIKWPNDIIYDGKKLCGILCERVDEYTVIGVGVNVNTKSFPKDISHKATSLCLLSGKENDIAEVFNALVSSFEVVLEKFELSFTKDAKELYESLCANLGKAVVTEKLSGTACGISDDGSLLIKTENRISSVSSGEVAIHGIY